MEREVTLAQAVCWTFALVGSVAALYQACLLLLSDHEQQAVMFGVGGLALLLWAGFHLTDR